MDNFIAASIVSICASLPSEGKPFAASTTNAPATSTVSREGSGCNSSQKARARLTGSYSRPGGTSGLIDSATHDSSQSSLSSTPSSAAAEATTATASSSGSG